MGWYIGAGFCLLLWVVTWDSPHTGAFSLAFLALGALLVGVKVFSKPSSSGSPSARTQGDLTLEQLQELTPQEFERFVADRFRDAGWRAKLTPASHDHGADILLSRQGEKAVAQCKRWRGVIPETKVRELLGTMTHLAASEAFLVTTGSFSGPAQAFAKSKPISLIDGAKLADWSP